MKKAIVSFLAVGLVFVGGTLAAKAQTVGELQAQIQALMQQINALQAQINAALPAQTNAQGQPFLTPSNPNIGAVPTEPTPEGVVASPEVKIPQACEIPQAVAIGLKSDGVRVLQRYLSLDEEVYPEGYVTGYYGSLTETALKLFQEKYNLPVSGALDEATKAKLNERIVVNRGAIPECGSGVAPTLETSATQSVTGESTIDATQPKNAPFILSMSPSSALAGVSVTISGGNFKPIKNDIKFGTVLITDVPSSNGTTLSFAVPQVNPGVYPVSVTNVAGTSALASFTVLGPPKVSSITPQRGVPGTKIYIGGSGFTSSNNVIFSPATDLSVTITVASGLAPDAGGYLSFVLPPAVSPGNYAVRIQNTNGITPLDQARSFAVDEATIRITPTSGVPGTKVYISPDTAKFTPTNNSVLFLLNGSVSSTVTVASGLAPDASGYLTFTLPPTAPGTYGVRVQNANGLTSLDTMPGFRVTDPTIRITPTSGVPGTKVYISPDTAKFTPSANTILFLLNGSTSSVITVASGLSPDSAGYLNFVLPPITPGTYGVRVQNANGLTSLTAMPGFRVEDPQISVTPQGGVPGTTVVVSRQNAIFTPSNNTVLFLLNGSTSSIITVASGLSPNSFGSLNFVLPPIAPGTYGVRVQNANGLTSLTAMPGFRVDAAVPAIKGISPTSGVPGTRVGIFGSGFTPGDNVIKFNATVVASVSPTDNNALYFNVPNLSPNTYQVTVTNANGTSNAVVFAIAVPPTITSILPTSGTPDALITLGGSGFITSSSTLAPNIGANTVNFISGTVIGGATSPYRVLVATNSATSLIFSPPSNIPAGIYGIYVTNVNGTSNTWWSYTVVAPSGGGGTSPTPGGTTQPISGSLLQSYQAQLEELTRQLNELLRQLQSAR